MTAAALARGVVRAIAGLALITALMLSGPLLTLAFDRSAATRGL
jgi:hypothetical protein